MAEEKKMEGEEEQPEGEEQEAPKKKGPLKLIVGLVLFIALGGMAAMMAIPGKEVVHRFKGPFHHTLLEKKFSSNVKDNQQRRYLQALLDIMYIAYDETYLPARILDPLYEPMLFDALGRVFAKKTLDEAFEGHAREMFLAELREALDPILFPIHIGDTSLPLVMDEASGIRPGLSFSESTFRGRFYDHILLVDTELMTIKFDEGEPVPYEGAEEDLRVINQAEEAIYVDLTEMNPEFVGELNVGVHGRIRRVLARELIAQ